MESGAETGAAEAAESSAEVSAGLGLFSLPAVSDGGSGASSRPMGRHSLISLGTH